MPAFICTTCGTQFAPSDAPPSRCAICDEERQYVAPRGQGWTTLEQIQGAGRPWLTSHRNGYTRYEPGVLGVATSPGIGIGQRALLLNTPQGNILWDCITYIDDATVEVIKALGGISAIAISHPHYYTTMVEWSHAFGRVPIYLHSGDREWVMRPDPVIEFWDGPTKELVPGVTMIHVAGHFSGAAVLHWQGHADGAGALFSGDSLQVVGPDKTISFMWSYPNLLPLDAKSVGRIAEVLEPWDFDAIYGAWPEALIATGAKKVLAHAVRRYVEAVSELPPGQRGADFAALPQRRSV